MRAERRRVRDVPPDTCRDVDCNVHCCGLARAKQKRDGVLQGGRPGMSLDVELYGVGSNLAQVAHPHRVGDLSARSAEER